MSDVIIRQNDRRPYLDCTLNDKDGAVDLTGETVRFVMRAQTGTVVANHTSTGAQVVILGATSGRVRYKWDDDDTENAGGFLAEFETWPTGSSSEVLTFPNRGHIEILVTPELSS